jgi:hypothetical protein
MHIYMPEVVGLESLITVTFAGHLFNARYTITYRYNGRRERTGRYPFSNILPVHTSSTCLWFLSWFRFVATTDEVVCRYKSV